MHKLAAKILIKILPLCFVIACATNHKRSDIKFTHFDEYIDQPVETIHKKLSKPLIGKQLTELVNWSLQKSPKVQTYLKEQLFLKAQFYYFDGDYSQAIQYYEQALNLDPKDYYIQTRYAISLIRTGKLHQSRGVLEIVYNNQPSEKVGLLLAGVLVSLDDIKTAQNIYKGIIKKNKKSQEACLFLGKSLAREEKSSAAIEQLQRCAVRMPKVARFPFEIAKIHANLKHFKTSRSYLKKTLRIDPKHSQAVLMLGSFDEKSGKDKKAYSIYKNYLAKNPNDFLILNKLASWHFDREESDEAIPYIEKLVDIDDSNSALRIRLGILYVENRRYNQAIDLFSEYLENNQKSPKVHYYLAAVYQEIEKFQEAIFHYSRIEQTSPLFEDSVLQIASILSYLAQESPDEFEQDLFAHYEKYKTRKKLQLELGIIQAAYFENIEEYKQSIQVLEELKANNSLQDSHTFYLISIYEKDGQYSKVDDSLLEMITKNPQNAKALNFLGYSYLERGIKMKKAFGYITKALSIKPNDGYIRDSLGWYYYLQGNYQRALEYLTKAYKDSGEDEEVAMHLADTYQALGQYQNAIVYYQKVLKKNKDQKLQERVAETMEKMLKLKNAKRLPASQK